MIAQYNTLRNQLTGDYQAFYDKAYQYAQERHYPGFYANDILMSLLDLLITAQMNHKELDTLIKENHDTFIKNYFHDQGKKTTCINSFFRYTIFLWNYVFYLILNPTSQAGGKVVEAMILIILIDLIMKNKRYNILLDYIVLALVFILPSISVPYMIPLIISIVLLIIGTLYQVYYTYTHQNTISYYSEEAQSQSNDYVNDILKKQNEEFNRNREKHHVPPLTLEEMKLYKKRRNRKIGLIIDVIVGILIFYLAYIIGDYKESMTMLSYYLPVYIIFSTRYLSYLVNPKGQLIHILNIIAVINLYFFIQVCHINHIAITVLCLIIIMIETGAMMMIPVFNNISEYFDQLISLFSVGFILVEMKVEFWLSAVILIVLFGALVKSIKKQKI
ncbi:hypothetical protein [Catenibacterium faecis]|uniref:hypothetical protein n=1 Tax=Catenibacterium faecis TaxID=2764323 RepID=UPI003F7D2025